MWAHFFLVGPRIDLSLKMGLLAVVLGTVHTYHTRLESANSRLRGEGGVEKPHSRQFFVRVFSSFSCLLKWYNCFVLCYWCTFVDPHTIFLNFDPPTTFVAPLPFSQNLNPPPFLPKFYPHPRRDKFWSTPLTRVTKIGAPPLLK